MFGIAKQQLGIAILKPLQQVFLEKISAGQDLCIVLPTGYGKSLSFQLAPFCGKERSRVIVVMPLNSLMSQQEKILTEKGFQACFINNSDSIHLTTLKDDRYTHIFTSPEILVSVILPELQAMTADQKQKFSHVFVDESHCVSRWGKRQSGDAVVFREAFSEIGKIRSFLPTAAMVALTATATLAVQTEITSALMMNSFSVVRTSPNRQNLRLSVVKCETKGYAVNFCALAQYLREQNTAADRFLIFCKQLPQVGRIYEYLVQEVGDSIVAMYHAHTSTTVQKKIMDDICSSSSHLRVVVCSSSFSMGLDIPHLRNIIHYGAPNNLDMYCQEVGRAGRDGLPSQAVLFKHPDALKGRNISADMKLYVSTTECRRKVILELFGCEQATHSEEACCDNCGNTKPLPWISSKADDQQRQLQQRLQMAPDSIAQCREDLLKLNETESPAGVLPYNITQPIYPSLIDIILSRYHSLVSASDVFKAGAYSQAIANRIVDVLDMHAPVTYIFTDSSAVDIETDYETDNSDTDSA